MNANKPNFFSGSKHVVLPVMHVESRDQALRNAELAHTAGSAGVFLINHSIHWFEGPVADLEQAAKIAARFMDVVTTSGPGTGRPAPREKIAAMNLRSMTNGITAMVSFGRWLAAGLG